MTITSPTRIAGELEPIESFKRSTGRSRSSFRSTTPSRPKSGNGRPVLASSAIMKYAGVRKMIRSSVPSVQ
jgi:hypothetical protein